MSYKYITKPLSLMLRHEPHKFGVSLDAEGFADFETVLDAMQLMRDITREDFLKAMESPEGKQRFEIRDGQIRALYGHSTQHLGQDIVYPPAAPPESLYHGTTLQAWERIREEGLTAQARQYVHLSTNRERALSVARRHGKPILIVIAAQRAYQDGHVFYHPQEEHYLVKSLPPVYLRDER